MLNKIALSKKTLSKAFLTLMFSGLIFNLNCGKRKPPLPPIERIIQRTEVSGIQRGNIVTLRWTLPAQNAPEKSLFNIARTDIYRLNEPANADLSLSEEEFASRSVLIASVPTVEKDFQAQVISFVDNLVFAGSNSRLRYALRFVNGSGQKGAFSNFLLIEPMVKIAASPNSLDVKVLEDAIALKWNAPTGNIDGSKPANIIGYNIYRIDNGNSDRLINRQPVTESFFRDSSFTFGKDYRYFVRALSLGGDGNPIESADSNSVAIQPSDSFPPSAPSAVTIAAAPGNLAIFFAVNSEKDTAGYRIYRSVERNKPLSEWNLLNLELLLTNTFQDRNVTSGVTYFYYLQAVDYAGNASQPSAVVFETAP